MNATASREEGEDPSKSVGERGIDLRLLGVAGGAWLGAVAGLNFTAGLTGTLAAATLLASVWCLLRSRGEALTLVVALVACAAALMVGGVAKARLDSSPLATAVDGETVVVVGKVVSDPKTSARSFGDGGTYTVTIQVRERGRATLRVGPKAEGYQGLVRGAEVEVEGKFQPFDDAKPPYLGSITASSIDVESPAGSWMVRVDRVKTALAAAAASFGGPNGALISGMALGDDRGLPEETHEAMLTTSLTHLTAVSGSHIAIALTFLRVVFPATRRVSAVLTWGFLVLVVVVVGPAASVVRAVSMGGLAAWGMVMRRSAQSLQLLSVVTLATVLISPWSAVNLGFALSTTATFGILTLGRLIAKWWRGVTADVPGSSLLSGFGDAVAIALAAQVATLPVLALINPWLPTWGVVANLLVTPLVAPLTLLGIGAAAFILPVPTIAVLLVKTARPLATGLAAVAVWVAGWPGAEMPWPRGPTGAALAIALTAAGLLVAHWLSDLRRGR